MIAVIGLIIGIVLGVLFDPTVPAWLAPTKRTPQSMVKVTLLMNTLLVVVVMTYWKLHLIR